LTKMKTNLDVTVHIIKDRLTRAMTYLGFFLLLEAIMALHSPSLIGAAT